MRHFLTFFTVGFLFALPAFAQSIAVADVDYLMNESQAAQSIKQQLQDQRAQFQKDFQSAQSKLQTRERNLAQQRSVLSQDELKEKVLSFREDMAAEQKKLQQRRDKLDEDFSEALQKLKAEIGKLIQETASEKGFDYVLPKRQILYAAAGQPDLTKELLQKLNARVKSIKIQ